MHEAPRVGRPRIESGREPMPGTVPISEHLDAGMTLTVEPGVYVPGRGGVRIEEFRLKQNEVAETEPTNQAACFNQTNAGLELCA